MGRWKETLLIAAIFALCRGQETAEKVQVQIDRTPKQLFPFYVTFVTLTLTLKTTITTASTSTTICTISTAAVCAGKRRRTLDDDWIPSAVERVEATEATSLDTLRQPRWTQWYPDDFGYYPQPTFQFFPAGMENRVANFRHDPLLLRGGTDHLSDADIQPRLLVATTLRTVTYFSTTTTSTTTLVPTCSYSTGFSKC